MGVPLLPLRASDGRNRIMGVLIPGLHPLEHARAVLGGQAFRGRQALIPSNGGGARGAELPEPIHGHIAAARHRRPSRHPPARIQSQTPGRRNRVRAHSRRPAMPLGAPKLRHSRILPESQRFVRLDGLGVGDSDDGNHVHLVDALRARFGIRRRRRRRDCGGDGGRGRADRRRPRPLAANRERGRALRLADRRNFLRLHGAFAVGNDHRLAWHVQISSSAVHSHDYGGGVFLGQGAGSSNALIARIA